MLVDKAEAAEKLGFVEFDCALPQGWLDETAEKLAGYMGWHRDRAYDLLRRYTIWCYDKQKVMGQPEYLSATLEFAMRNMETDYAIG